MKRGEPAEKISFLMIPWVNLYISTKLSEIYVNHYNVPSELKINVSEEKIKSESKYRLKGPCRIVDYTIGIFDSKRFNLFINGLWDYSLLNTEDMNAPFRP
jgi:hypothetical protein